MTELKESLDIKGTYFVTTCNQGEGYYITILCRLYKSRRILRLANQLEYTVHLSFSILRCWSLFGKIHISVHRDVITITLR
jgi:hypothetical protein